MCGITVMSKRAWDQLIKSIQTQVLSVYEIQRERATINMSWSSLTDLNDLFHFAVQRTLFDITGKWRATGVKTSNVRKS